MLENSLLEELLAVAAADKNQVSCILMNVVKGLPYMSSAQRSEGKGGCVDTTGFDCKVVPRLRECCGLSHAATNLSKPWNRLIYKPCTR